jgi:hypothetical protein
MAVRHRPSASLLLLAAVSAAPAAEDWYPGTDLQLEAHGFASFGFLDTWGDNWLGPSRDGSAQFWEAATNVVARPMDRLRLGAQLYARDLVDYDNGEVLLDWAYADYRVADGLGIQVGRVKIPIGLYNEDIDVDVARASVFMPVRFYSLIDRDLYIATNGAKVYGTITLGDAGSADYSIYGGKKPVHTDGAFATHISKAFGLGDQVDGVKIAWSAGGMLQWNTPVAGLAFRVSLAHLHDLEVESHSSLTGFQFSTTSSYYAGIASCQYDIDRVTLAAEGMRLRGRGGEVVQPIGVAQPLIDNEQNAYISATWHVRRWLELYEAFEASWSDAHQLSGTHAYAWVGAINVMPLRNWSLKAEFQEVEGTFGIYAADNPQGLDKHWQILALKTTVDF